MVCVHTRAINFGCISSTSLCSAFSSPAVISAQLVAGCTDAASSSIGGDIPCCSIDRSVAISTGGTSDGREVSLLCGWDCCFPCALVVLTDDVDDDDDDGTSFR